MALSTIGDLGMWEDMLPKEPPVARLPKDVATDVVASVERIRARQNDQGAVVGDFITEATALLCDIIQTLTPFISQFPSLATCLHDMDDWLEAGLGTAPQMHHLIKWGLAPVTTVNDIVLTVTNTLNHSDNYTLEFLYFSRQETPPAIALREVFPCPNLTFAHLIAATGGFDLTSNCIVCFTESLAGGIGAPDVMDIFITSKNAWRCQTILQPMMERLLAPGCFTELRTATLAALDQMVLCNTITHEWSHGQGALPLTLFRDFFENEIDASFEEARVEIEGAYLLLALAASGHEHADIYTLAAQFIIADNLLRYPSSAHPSNNSDAICGQYFFGQFVDKQLLTFNAGRLMLAPMPDLITGLQKMRQEMRDVQYQALIADVAAGRQVVRAHVLRYSPTQDTQGVMQRSLFYQWLVAQI